MKRKLIKTIIIVSIVLYYSFSYAAISVSDGSAFVAKTEFDSVLSNLTSRLSQMENSLEGKIDSLVSSYLSRNGIWNGVKQTLKNSKLDVFTSLGTLSMQTVYDINQSQKIIVDELSKTGMAIVNITWSSSGSYPRLYYLGSTTHTRTDNASAREFNIYITEQTPTMTSFDRTERYLRSKIQLGTSNYNVTSEGMYSEVVLPKTGVATAMFFVSKGNKMWACENFYYYEYYVNLAITSQSMPEFEFEVTIY